MLGVPSSTECIALYTICTYTQHFRDRLSLIKGNEFAANENISPYSLIVSHIGSHIPYIRCMHCSKCETVNTEYDVHVFNVQTVEH